MAWVCGNDQYPPHRPLTLSLDRSNTADRMPRAHTCFAQIDLCVCRYVQLDAEKQNFDEELPNSRQRMLEDLREAIACMDFLLEA